MNPLPIIVLTSASMDILKLRDFVHSLGGEWSVYHPKNQWGEITYDSGSVLVHGDFALEQWYQPEKIKLLRVGLRAVRAAVMLITRGDPSTIQRTQDVASAMTRRWGGVVIDLPDLMDSISRSAPKDRHFISEAMIYEVINGLLTRGEVSDEMRSTLRSIAREFPGAVNYRDKLGEYTPLCWAMGNAKIARLLLEFGADPNVKYRDGESPLHSVCRMTSSQQPPGHMECIELLVAHGADVTAQDKYGYTPLHLAVGVPLWMMKAADIERIVSLLLAGGAKANAVANDGNTPLHFAGSDSAARVLVEHGADVNAQNAAGVTPLVKHAGGPTKLVRVLLDAGADISVADQDGRTPLHHAVMDKDMARGAINRILKLGPSLEAQDRIGRTPLHYAAGSHFIGAVQMLLQAGADVNARDVDGKTPLAIVEAGEYTGLNDYYPPPPIGLGTGNEKVFKKAQDWTASILRRAGGLST